MTAILLLLVSLLGQPLIGQSTTARDPGLPTCSSERERLITPAIHQHDCLLGVGDSFEIMVPGDHDCYQRGPLRVAADGTVTVGRREGIPAAGLTLSQLSAQIEKLLAPVCSIRSGLSLMLEPVEPTFWLFGDMVLQGRFRLIGSLTVRDAIDRGYVLNRPKKNYIIHVTRHRTRLKRRYNDLLEHPERNFAIESGDILYVEK